MARQTNFSGGELDPLLHGRTDLPVFGRGLRSCLNFQITKSGAAMSRPGTTYVSTLKTPVKADGSSPGPNKVRLIGFNAANDESFVVMLGYQYARFFTLGGEVLLAGNPYEIATPYGLADLPLLKWAQVGEVITITCPGRDPYELRHVSDAPPSWTLTPAVTAGFVPWFIDSDGVTPTLAPAVVLPLGAVDTDHPAREWLWEVTALVRNDRTGQLTETLPKRVTRQYDGADYDGTNAALASTFISIYSDRAVILRRPTSATAVGPDFGAGDTYTVVNYNYYRGRGGLYGFIGSTTDRDFVDVGDEPDYATQPPVGTNPFGKQLSAEPLHANRPAAVTYFENRRVFGGMLTREHDIAFSATGDFNNFDQRKLLHVSGESLLFTLAAYRREEIRHLLTMHRLLIFTSSSSWSGGGAQGPLDFDSVDFRLEDSNGATQVPPLVVDKSALFCRSKGAGVTALVPQGQVLALEGLDLSELATHLFRGKLKAISDWAYAESPWGVVWAARDDGVMLSLTFSRSREMWAWARHVTDGLVEQVCAVPEGDEDAVYLVVKRTINGVDKRYLERMTSRVQRGGAVLNSAGTALLIPPDDLCVDCAFEYIGPAVTTFTGLDHLEGEDVYVIAQGSPVIGPLTVTAGQVTMDTQLDANIDSDAGKKLVAYVGLLYTPELELLDIAGGEARLKAKQVTHVGFEVDQSKGVNVGQDFDHLDDWTQRDVSDSYGTINPQTTILKTPVAGTWDLSARAVLRQTLPLPVTVVGLTRRLASGDD